MSWFSLVLLALPVPGSPLAPPSYLAVLHSGEQTLMSGDPITLISDILICKTGMEQDRPCRQCRD